MIVICPKWSLSGDTSHPLELVINSCFRIYVSRQPNRLGIYDGFDEARVIQTLQKPFRSPRQLYVVSAVSSGAVDCYITQLSECGRYLEDLYWDRTRCPREPEE